VKSHPWFNPWLVGRVIAASALSCAAVAQPQSQFSPAAVSAADSPLHSRPTLSQALEAAWQRSQEATEATGQQRRAQAEQGAAGAWLAAAPAFELSQREGRRNSGDRETEIGVALPLWRPGQRALVGQAAQAEIDWAASAQQAARLRLAGQIRETAGALQAQESEARLTGLQRQLLQRLCDDVARRVKAGDLAPADALAARADLLAADVLDTEAQQKLQVQRAQWQLLTGLALAPGPEPEPAPAPSTTAPVTTLDAHPEQGLARQSLDRARRRLTMVQAQRGESPELGVSLRQERPGRGTGTQHSVALGLRIPFGTDTHSQPRLAAALAEQELAHTMEQRTRARLSTERELAQSQLLSSTAQAQLESDRAALLRERATLIDKSFKAGETALPELLRALNAAAQAETAAARQQGALSLARARLQQASGLLP